MDEILEILEKDARISVEEIAKMLKKKPADVRKKIEQYEKDGIIIAYKTVINRELVKEKNSEVKAIIEVNLVPQKDLGFDKIAERIYSFPEVSGCFLVSGTYDLLVFVRGKDLHTVARFISEKLSPMENVRGVVTHFLLKKYKDDGIMLKQREEDQRIAISY